MNKSRLGYSRNSPYKNDPFIDIFTPHGTIDMSNTDKDLLGVDEYGNAQMMMAGAGNPYVFQGQHVREIPMQEGGWMPNAGNKGMIGDMTYMDALRNAEKLRVKKSGNYKALIPMEWWNDDMMNYIDKFKIVKRKGEQYIKARGELPKGMHQMPDGSLMPDEEMLQGGGSMPPIYTSNPNDPRLKAYQDSSFVYDRYLSDDNFWSTLDGTVVKNRNRQGVYPEAVLKNSAVGSKNLQMNPIAYNNYNYTQGKYTTDRVTVPVYKEPVQPVIYQEPKPKGKPTYQDSLAAYNFGVKNKRTDNLYGPDWDKNIEQEKKFERMGIRPIDRVAGELDLPYYKKPVGTPKPKRRTSSAQLIPDEMDEMSMQVQGRTSPTVDVNKEIRTPFFRTYRRDDGSQGTQYYPTYESFKEDTKDRPYINQQVAGDKSSARLTGYKKGGNPYQMGGSMNDLFTYLFEDEDSTPSSTEQPTAPSTEELDAREEALNLRERELNDQAQYNLAMQVAGEPFDEQLPYSQRFKRAFGSQGTDIGNNGFRTFGSYAEGRSALERQLELYKTGRTRNPVNPNSTLLQAMSVYAPASDNNDPRGYASFIAKKLGVSVDTPISQLPTSKWADAIEIMEGNTKGNNPGNLRY